MRPTTTTTYIFYANRTDELGPVVVYLWGLLQANLCPLGFFNAEASFTKNTFSKRIYDCISGLIGGLANIWLLDQTSRDISLEFAKCQWRIEEKPRFILSIRAHHIPTILCWHVYVWRSTETGNLRTLDPLYIPMAFYCDRCYLNY